MRADSCLWDNVNAWLTLRNHFQTPLDRLWVTLGLRLGLRLGRNCVFFLCFNTVFGITLGLRLGYAWVTLGLRLGFVSFPVVLQHFLHLRLRLGYAWVTLGTYILVVFSPRPLRRLVSVLRP
jgi:hypothetical protein